MVRHCLEIIKQLVGLLNPGHLSVIMETNQYMPSERKCNGRIRAIIMKLCGSWARCIFKWLFLVPLGTAWKGAVGQRY